MIYGSGQPYKFLYVPWNSCAMVVVEVITAYQFQRRPTEAHIGNIYFVNVHNGCPILKL